VKTLLVKTIYIYIHREGKSTLQINVDDLILILFNIVNFWLLLDIKVTKYREFISNT